MSAKARRPQSRRHILVFDEDWEYLDAIYGTASTNRLGVGPAIREVIHTYVSKLKAKTEAILDEARPGASQDGDPNAQ